MKLRRTKIVATLGPATDAPDMLERVLRAGVNVVRVNFSHGAEKVRARIDAVRACAKKLGITVGVLGDLQGPKIRIACFQEGSVVLAPGAEFTLDAALDTELGTDATVGIDYKELINDVSSGDILLLDDGLIVLNVKEVKASRIICQVDVGGVLSNNKGINRLGGGLSAEALTDKDREDIKVAVAAEVDYVAISFPRDARDMKLARKMLKSAGGKAGLIAKIERAEAIDNIDEIIQESDGVMVARGDLAVEIGAAQVPGAQKEIIRRAQALDKPVITATQMMESMIESAIPTRAEVSDVANAVLDQTDAVMLSAESAVGRHPDKVVETMARICIAAERERETHISSHRMEMEFTRIDEAIAMAALYTANHLSIKAIITLTESGSTPLTMSRIKTSIPIYALSRHVETLARMTLYRNVYPTFFDFTKVKVEKINSASVKILEDQGLVTEDDFIILTKGDHIGTHGGTNSMKIIRVGEVI